MRKILIRWLTDAIPVVFGVSVVTFILTSLVPGNAGQTILGPNATPAQVAALDSQLGLDRPLPVRYWEWLVAALHGNLGTSITTGVPVTQELAARIWVTLSLIVGALLLAAIVGVGFGLVSALYGGWPGRVVDVLAMLGMAIPNFWFALVLITFLAVKRPIFPATGYTPLSQDPVAWFESLVLPVLTLGLSSAAPVAKATRDGVLTQLGRDYVRVLRARGIPERSVIFRHVLRNAAAPVITVLGVLVVTLFGGTVLIESAFVMPGLGQLVVQAASAHDIALVQGVALVFTIVIMLANLLIELAYAAINPRVRHGH